MKATKLLQIPDNFLITLKDEVARNYHLFGVESFREDHPDSPHKDTQSIYLRMSKIESKDDMHNELWADNTIHLNEFPSVRSFLKVLMSELGGAVLGRVMLISLKGKGTIDLHKDEGKYPETYSRYHIPIFTENCEFIVGSEGFWMQEGELWLIDNELKHEVINHSDKERIHLVVDIKHI